VDIPFEIYDILNYILGQSQQINMSSLSSSEIMENVPSRNYLSSKKGKPAYHETDDSFLFSKENIILSKALSGRSKPAFLSSSPKK